MNRRCKAIALVVFAALLGGCAAVPQRARPQRIETLERVRLGGLEQTILIHGDDPANPLLLFLHGGPALPNIPFARINAGLERDFLVVDWDQRGAGKSYHAGIPPDSMRIEQFVRDTEELARLLKRRFGDRKIILVAHSWGSLFGAIAASRSPELFAAYVGISQVVDVPESERVLHEWTLDLARRKGDHRALRELERIGRPPYRTIKDERTVNALTKRLVGRDLHEISTFRMIGVALGSPHFSIGEVPRLYRGMRFSGRLLRNEIYSADLTRSAPEIDVPVYFLLSRDDTIISAEVGARYFATLRAPRGKKLIWFERSNHNPHLEEPEKFQSVMRRIRFEVRVSE